MIIREKEPANLEMPISALDRPITPNELFYVRSHFPVQRIDPREFRLKIEGAVEREMELSFEDLLALPRRKMHATIECAGNSRVFLTPKADGVQWELGAVGNAGWTGVLLRDLLERAGVKSGTVDVILEGADSGEIGKAPRPAGPVHFTRSVPIAKAIDDVLLAFEMNGEPLTPAHGFPLRALVPGWYGMASIKWLQRIVVSTERFQGYYETFDYAYWEPRREGPALVPLREMQVKSVIARPGVSETVPADSNYRVTGAAWTSGAEITRVEVSTNAGETWQQAKLLGDSIPNTWRLWELDWRTPSHPCSCTLMSRATDSRGRTQPMTHDPNRGSYMINFCLPVEVEVR